MPNALALVATLKPSPEPSSSELMARQLLDALAGYGFDTESIRLADHRILPGVRIDMGGDDQWPSIREKVIGADVLVLATPTWMGHMSHLAQQALERLDAELAQTQPNGNPVLFGKVAIVAVVGNEDGAHQISAELYQALNDVGYTIPAQAVAYWNGAAMGSTDYQDLEQTPDAVLATIRTAAANAAHLAGLLADEPYPAS